MPTNVIMPQMGESIFEGTITKWMKRLGDRVERDEALFEISTDKVDSEIPAPVSGVLSELRFQVGETVEINTVVAIIDDEDGAVGTTNSVNLDQQVANEGKASQLQHSKSELSKNQVAQRSSPLVKRMAREEKVDLSDVEGTGLGGRITKQDMLDYLSERNKIVEVARPLVQPVQKESVSFITSSGDDEVVPMSAMRKTIADHMIASRRTSAHVTTVFEVNMTPIVALRKQLADEFIRKEGFKLSFMPFFIKGVVDSLKKFPVMNASLKGNNIIYRKEINIGIAVALEEGLIVPVIQGVHEIGFMSLARAAVDLTDRARQKTLSPDEVQGGTFTITNPGVFGSLLGTPIINQPQVAILCVGAITKRPVVINDAVVIRSMAYLSLTFDHRLIDGALADYFMSSIKNKLEGWNDSIC